MNYKQTKIKELKAQQQNKVLNEAVQQLTHIKSKIILEWGKQRIMGLISPELLLRFKRAEKKYNNEYSQANEIKYTQMMTRAYEALIVDATNRGYNTLSPEFIYTEHPSTNDKIIICINKDDVPIAFQKYKSKENVIIFHINEILISMTKDFIKTKKMVHKISGVITQYESINT